ncbi:MAG: hypothetical protein MJZ37_00455 [Bacilli bacterium]|nr:hypothetical protein [Bacilli bacterium]
MAETTFIRTKKDRDFTLLDNTFLRDPNLSAAAKGVFAYLLYLPEDWVIYQSELKNHFSNGRDSLRAIISELERFGYIIKEKNRTETGKFSGYKYQIVEKPEPCSISRDGFSAAAKPKSENPTLLNTNNNQILNKLNTNTTNTPSPSEIELQKKLDEANKKIEEQEQTLSKLNKKTKKSDTTTLCEPDFYTSLLNAYKKVFFSVRKSGVPCTKDYKKYVDKALLRLRELGLSDNEAHDRMLEAINNAPTLDYWVNEAKCAFAYIVSDYGLSKLCGSSQNLKKGGGSVVAQKGNGEFDELGIPF